MLESRKMLIGCHSHLSLLWKVKEEGKSQDLHYSEPKQCLEEIHYLHLKQLYNQKIFRQSSNHYTCLFRLSKKGSSTWSNPCWVSIGW